MASSLKAAAAVAVCVMLVLNLGHPAAATECDNCLGDCVPICVAFAQTSCSGICNATPPSPACQTCKNAALIECGATCYGGCTLFC
ncbi:hypothetical protein CFC21_000113 [Triticum aestivum]|uniref:Uncharacterized protein n=1 Tax=Triticum aestivum TaxID=4565 RepID=A0A3B5XTB4_WHEAT|nr:hypothetical protein CFC21_000113 [Triticum aestivum]